MDATRRFLAAAIALALLATLSACGYSLAGRGSFLPEGIKVIGIPTFTNITPVYDAERKITERVRSEFIGRGKWKVQPETPGADAVVTGEITAITLTPASFTDQRQASNYTLTVTAKVEFKDVRADKILWSNPAMQFREEYEITNTTVPDPTAFFGQDSNALDRVAMEFARSIVSAILEAF
jgi:hypothetical protein